MFDGRKKQKYKQPALIWNTSFGQVKPNRFFDYYNVACVSKKMNGNKKN